MTNFQNWICPPLCSQQEEPDVFLEKNTTISCQLGNLNEDNVSHTEEVIIGSEQGTTFPTKICTTMRNALIDTGDYKKLHK